MLQLSSMAQKEKFSANTAMLSTLVIVQSQNTKGGMIPRLSWERRERWTPVLAATEKFFWPSLRGEVDPILKLLWSAFASQPWATGKLFNYRLTANSVPPGCCQKEVAGIWMGAGQNRSRSNA